MDRATLEIKSINQLRSIAASLNLTVTGSRGRILDRILDFYDRSGPVISSAMEPVRGIDEGASEENLMQPEVLAGSSGPGVSRSGPAATVNLEEIVRAVVSVLDAREREPRRERRLFLRQGPALVIPVIKI